jgi:hypothetical protein
MSNNKYLDFLEPIKHLEWAMDECGAIYVRSTGECPICAYVNLTAPHPERAPFRIMAFDALEYLNGSLTGADMLEANAFIWAVDNRDGCDAELRQEILNRLNPVHHV